MDAQPRIRQASALDLEAALAMKDAAWRETYPGLVPGEVLAGLDARRPAAIAHWEERLATGHYLWLAVAGPDVVGFAAAGVRRDDDIDVLLELQALYLLDRVKGTGLASALMQTAIGDADAYLWVVDGNERALVFYRNEGFVPDGAVRETHGIPGVREVRMVRRSDAD